MKKNILLIILISSISICSIAQNVGIGTDDPKVRLDIVADNVADPDSATGILIPRIDSFPIINPGAEQNSMLVFVNYDSTFYYWNNSTTTWIPLQTGVDNDNQDLSLSSNTLSLTNDGTTVNLSPYLDNTDEQRTDVFQFVGNNLQLSLQNDGVATQSVNLSSLLDNTDEQDLDFVGTTLFITGGNSVNLNNIGGDITGVTAGDGLVNGGTAGNVTLDVVGANGLTDNANDISLGGTLTQATTITQGTNNMIYNLDGTGDFIVQEAGTNQFVVQDNGDVRADNATFYVDASTDRVGIGTTAPGDKLHVVGDILLTGGVRNIEIQAGDQSIQLDDANPIWNGFTYGGVTRFFGDGTLASSKLEAGGLQLERTIQIKGGAPALGKVLTSDAAGNATWQVPTVGDITGVTAGDGLTGGGTAGNVTLNVVGANGLTDNANDIILGGTLTQATTITQGTNNMTFNLNSTGDFHIQDDGTDHFSVTDNGNIAFGGDVQWRDENTAGTILAQLLDDGNDGRFIVSENGATSVDLDANTQFIFNEQGLDRNFRIESDGNANMMFVDAGLNRVSIGTSTTAGTFNVEGTSYHSDDIYLRDGAVNGGDVLVRIFDSADDGIIDVYENNALNHRIHGNGVTVFNEQGNNNADFRVESDLNANMLFVDAGLNSIGIGTATPDNALDVNGKISITQSVGDEMVIINDDLWTHSIGIQDFGDGGDHFIMASREGANESAGIHGDGDNITIWSAGDAATGQTAALIYVCDEDRFNATVDPYDNTALIAYLNNSGNWVAASDKNRKENIAPLSNSLEKLLQLNGYSYNFKLTESEIEKGDIPVTTLGVIAQEVDKVLPNLVDKSEAGEYFVSYTEFIPVLIESIKEQQELIETLQKQMEELKLLIK